MTNATTETVNLNVAHQGVVQVIDYRSGDSVMSLYDAATNKVATSIDVQTNGNVTMGRFDTQNRTSWAAQTETYNSNGQLIGMEIIRHDGTHGAADIDPNNQFVTAVHGQWAEASFYTNDLAQVTYADVNGSNTAIGSSFANLSAANANLGADLSATDLQAGKAGLVGRAIGIGVAIEHVVEKLGVVNTAVDLFNNIAQFLGNLPDLVPSFQPNFNAPNYQPPTLDLPGIVSTDPASTTPDNSHDFDVGDHGAVAGPV